MILAQSQIRSIAVTVPVTGSGLGRPGAAAGGILIFKSLGTSHGRRPAEFDFQVTEVKSWSRRHSRRFDRIIAAPASKSEANGNMILVMLRLQFRNVTATVTVEIQVVGSLLKSLIGTRTQTDPHLLSFTVFVHSSCSERKLQLKLDVHSFKFQKRGYPTKEEADPGRAP